MEPKILGLKYGAQDLTNENLTNKVWFGRQVRLPTNQKKWVTLTIGLKGANVQRGSVIGWLVGWQGGGPKCKGGWMIYRSLYPKRFEPMLGGYQLLNIPKRFEPMLRGYQLLNIP